MATIVKTSDFEDGILRIAQDKYDDFSSYLSEVKENSLIKHIFGATEGDKLIADLTGDPRVPVSSIWLDIWDPFEFSIQEHSYYCVGIKEVILMLTYREIVGEMGVVNLQTGNKKIKGQATEGQGIIRKEVVIHNRAAMSVATLQKYIQENGITYPDYSGDTLQMESMI